MIKKIRKVFLTAELEFARFLWNVLVDLGSPSTGFTNSVHWAAKVKSVSALSMLSPIRYCHQLYFLQFKYLFIALVYHSNSIKVTRDRREMLKREEKNPGNVQPEMLEPDQIEKESSTWNCGSNVNFQLILSY